MALVSRILLIALGFIVIPAPDAVAQARSDVPVAVAAIEFATRNLPSNVSLLVDARAAHPDADGEVAEALDALGREVAEALDASVGELDAVLVCSEQRAINPCDIPEGVAVVAYKALHSEGEPPRIQVRLWEHSPMRDWVHFSAVELELGDSSDGWEVTRVLFRAAN